MNLYKDILDIIYDYKYDLEILEKKKKLHKEYFDTYEFDCKVDNRFIFYISNFDNTRFIKNKKKKIIFCYSYLSNYYNSLHFKFDYSYMSIYNIIDGKLVHKKY